MAFLRDIEQVRKIEWARKYSWDIRFDDPTLPDPFTDWFPAIDVEEGRAAVKSFSFDAFLSTYKIPKNSTFRTLRITFNDREDNLLANWLDNWVNREIFNSGNHVSTLFGSNAGGTNGAVKTIQIMKLNSRKQPVEVLTYLIYPETEFIFNGTSASEPQIYSVPFVIIKEIGVKQIFPRVT